MSQNKANSDPAIAKLVAQVLEFNKTFAIPTSSTPHMPSAKRCVARQMVIQKQVDDLSSTWNEQNVSAVAIALTNAIYTLISTACEFGLKDKFEACMDEVHRANMSNVDKNGRPVLIEGKIIQSEFYKVPNLSAILEKADLQLV